jgi:hypothetical protein
VSPFTNSPGDAKTATHVYETVGLSFGILATVTNGSRTFYQNELVIGSQDGPVFLPDPIDKRYFQEMIRKLLFFAVLGPGNNRIYFPSHPSQNDSNFYVADVISPQSPVIPISTGGAISTLCVRGKELLIVPDATPTKVERWDTDTLKKVGEFDIDVAVGPQMIVDPRDGGLVYSSRNGGIYRLRPQQNVSELLVMTPRGGSFAMDKRFVYWIDLNVQARGFPRFDLDLGVNNQPGTEFAANVSKSWFNVRGVTFGPDGHIWVADHIYMEIYTRDTEQRLLSQPFERGNCQMVFLPTHYVWTRNASEESSFTVTPSSTEFLSMSSSPESSDTALRDGLLAAGVLVALAVLVLFVIGFVRWWRKREAAEKSEVGSRREVSEPQEMQTTRNSIRDA